jgi:hypothetical protein
MSKWHSSSFFFYHKKNPGGRNLGENGPSHEQRLTLTYLMVKVVAKQVKVNEKGYLFI